MKVFPAERHSLNPLGGVAPQIAAPPMAPIREQRAVHEPFGNPPTEPDADDRLHFAPAPLGTLQLCTRMSTTRSTRGWSRT